MTGPSTTTVTIATLCNAIETTLATAVSDIERTQSYDELTEGIMDLPLLQVYPTEWSASRMTFKGGVQISPIVFRADLYAMQRGPDIGQEVGTLIPLVDAINAELIGQDAGSLFGNASIKAFTWQGSYSIFDYSGVRYVGARYIITVTVF